MHLKLEGLRTMSLSQFFLVMAAISIIVLGGFLLNAISKLSVAESLIVVSTPVILTLALIWSVCEIKRLSR
jgi:drug/metabolite transporter (DMT)-like permease